jgi:hypothetical protein
MSFSIIFYKKIKNKKIKIKIIRTKIKISITNRTTLKFRMVSVIFEGSGKKKKWRERKESGSVMLDRSN